MKTIKIIQDTFVAGKLFAANDSPVEVEDSVASVLVSNYKAEYCKTKQPANPMSETTGDEKIAETKKPLWGRKEKRP